LISAMINANFSKIIAFFICLLQLTHAQHNKRPVIGILDMPSIFNPTPGATYIPASYVQWLQSAGAMVVPIPYNADPPALVGIFKNINGILFPGGDVNVEDPTDLYHASTAILFKLAIEENILRDNSFPIWGTCLGFRQLMMIVADKFRLFEQFDSSVLPLKLNFEGKILESKLFSSDHINWQIQDNLANRGACQNIHNNSISVATFKAEQSLVSFFTILSTSVDRNNKTFISTIEAKDFPFFGTQWHPERNQFEWDDTEDIAVDQQSLVSMQYLANFFVEQARKSDHVFDPSVLAGVTGLIEFSSNYELKYTQPLSYYTMANQKNVLNKKLRIH